MTFAIAFPHFDPILVSFGPIAIRWYALAYVVGLLLGWRIMRRLVRLSPEAATADDVDDFLVWATLGVVIGGRLGYVFFYNPAHYAANPLAALAVWHGGMSFHGGLVGVVAAGMLFVRRRGIKALPFADRIACVAPIGLLLGRVANFVNGELWGRPSDAPWAVVFPRGGPAPRHPSQLYEALLEGVVLLAVLLILVRNARARQSAGLLTGIFFLGYGIARIIAEFFREPDIQIGFLAGGTTMGQWLSVPMVAAGIVLLVRARHG